MYIYIYIYKWNYKYIRDKHLVVPKCFLFFSTLHHFSFLITLTCASSPMLLVHVKWVSSELPRGKKSSQVTSAPSFFLLLAFVTTQQVPTCPGEPIAPSLLHLTLFFSLHFVLNLKRKMKDIYVKKSPMEVEKTLQVVEQWKCDINVS